MLATIIAHTNYVTYILIYIYVHILYTHIIAYDSLCCSRILLSWVSHGPGHKMCHKICQGPQCNLKCSVALCWPQDHFSIQKWGEQETLNMDLCLVFLC